MGLDNVGHPTTAGNKLRRKAEEYLQEQFSAQPLRTEVETQKLLHELHVHQLELEMQNEELRRVQVELELSQDKFTQLYNFAPVGYLILDANGLIRGANHAGAKLLGQDRQTLVNKPFIRFIADSTGKEAFSKHLESVLQQQVILCCEIRLSGQEGSLIHGRLQSVVVNSESGKCILTSIFDITESRNLADQLQTAHDTLEDLVAERTKALRQANQQLTQEIENHKNAEVKLQEATAEIRQLNARLKSENIQLQQELTRSDNFGEIIGQSPAISYVFYRVDQVASQDTTVLLLGETGTGKGMVAREIHRRSTRKDRPLVTVNCTALPANLIESELFGREKGAFTGAHARQMGRFELADGGTLFLDEIGEMPLELQVKLLRVIQDGEFERLGSPRTIKVNVRIIAASNRNLEEAIKAGQFREDLFYRLSVFPITIPPLRQRLEDIPLLVRYFVAKFNKKTGKRIENISQTTLDALQKYNWPGNVRELESVIERAIITSQGAALQVLDRFENFRDHQEQGAQDVTALADLERDHILQVLEKTGWRVEGEKGAALLLGLNPSTLRARMRKYDIRRQ